ncbi:hypothetical protein TSH58p_17555 [Azospirillum sp. TSH58]|uniref:hypothetical protein n=1 Tax=Azospirillum sp. TSH58 TaxID=664962 RepID=UPI000D600C2D|nr:hypothetical protein [Azospirillum sp. TSH58]AWJ85170.1 hypothetical protein TSH58p_17555 [Azospirillum sp. TSH58]PWC80843.1 hypothetical protein TSH58_00960 [Azospirillum sp. TSH58]
MSKKKTKARVRDAQAAAPSAPPVPAFWGAAPDRLLKNLNVPGVYTFRGPIDGRETVRHFRVSQVAGGLLLTDATEAVALELVEHARQKVDASAAAERARVALIGARSPNEIRAARGDVVAEQTMKAGVTRGRALTSLGTLQQRHLLTMRQFEAGDRLAQDVKTVAGAREARDDAAPEYSPIGGRAWEDFAVAAGRNLELVKRACSDLPWYDGISLWTIVEDIVIHEKTMREAAGGRSAVQQARAKTALRIALDVVGDIYELPADIKRTRVLFNGVPVEMRYCEDIDGLNEEGEPRIIPRAIKLKGKRWVETAPTMQKLYDRAKKRLSSCLD